MRPRIEKIRVELVDPPEDVTIPKVLELQFWPSSINVKINPTYEKIEYPGGTIPLTYWIKTGGKVISLNAEFYRETLTPVPAGQFYLDSYNCDIDRVVAWLQRCLLPAKTTEQWIKPPPILALYIPNTVFNFGKQDWMYCVLTDLGVDYKKWFENGIPRHAQIDMEFSEILKDYLRDQPPVR